MGDSSSTFRISQGVVLLKVSPKLPVGKSRIIGGSYMLLLFCSVLSYEVALSHILIDM